MIFIHGLIGAVSGVTVNIATTNWHSFNIFSKAIQTLLSDGGLTIKEVRYESLRQAVEGFRNGEVDIIPEAGPCVNHSECLGSTSFCASPSECRKCGDCTTCSDGIGSTCGPKCPPCDSPAPTITNVEIDRHEWGFNLEEGVYIPDYLALSNDWRDWDDGGSEENKLGNLILHFVGPTKEWNGYEPINLLAAEMGFDVTTPSSAAEHQKMVFDRMKWQEPFAFYLWSPHAIPANYRVKKVMLPSNLVDKFWPKAMSLIWRKSIATEAQEILANIQWSVTSKDVEEAIDRITTEMSLALDYKDAIYQEGLRVAGNWLLCEKINLKCSDVELNWINSVRLKDLPKRLLVWTKHCEGFSHCPDGSDEPTGGYSIEHLGIVLGNIGYKRGEGKIIKEGEYKIQCYHGTDGTHGMVKKVGMELADLGHACITISPTRQVLADFTPPFFNTGLRLATRRGKGILEYTKEEREKLVGETEERQLIILREIDESKRTWDQLLGLFRKGFPDVTTWILIFVFSFIPLMLIGILESFWGKKVGESNSRVDDEISPSIRTPEGVPTIRGRAIRALGKLENGFTIAASVVAGETHMSSLKNRLGYVVALFLTIFLMLANMMYMANLTANEITELMSSNVGIKNIEGMRDKTVAIQRGSSGLMWLEKYEPKVKIFEVDPTDSEAMVRAVRDGKADGFVYDDQTVSRLVSKYCQEFISIGDLFYRHDYGIALPKDSPLLKPLNLAVTAHTEGVVAADWKNKTMHKYGMQPDGDVKCKNEDDQKRLDELEGAENVKIPELSVLGLFLFFIILWLIIEFVSHLFRVVVNVLRGKSWYDGILSGFFFGYN